MRIIKLALISFIVFFLLALAISFILPSKLNISRSIEISSSKEKVFHNIGDVNRWKFWIANKDSVPVSVIVSTKKIFVMGSTKAWIVASGSEKVIVKWQVNNGQIVSSDFIISEQDGANKVKLEWNFIQRVNWYPWEKFALIASEKSFGNFMEACLENLKRHSEGETAE